MKERPLPVSAAVIAGGANSRMGYPKGLLEIGGIPIITRVVDVLETVAKDLVCVTCRPEEYRCEGGRVRFVPDYGETPRGPLSGIVGALAAARYPVCLVVAVDMPFLNPTLLRHLLSYAVRGAGRGQGADDTQYADVVVPVIEDDRPENLHAVYRSTALSAGVEALTADRRRVSAFYRDLSVKRVSAEEVRRFDPELRSFENVNTPAELQRVLKQRA